MKLSRSLFAIALWIAAGTALSASADEPYEPTWESLTQRGFPDWFRDAKFGIYAHWGPYSATGAPELTDWYSHHMFEPDHPIHDFHLKTYGPPREYSYERFIHRFTAERFDAEAWADLFVDSGARFAGPVAEHADGFAMWPSDVTPWNAVEMGPKRDVVGEMEAAVRKRGLRFMTSLHHHWKWAWYPTGTPQVDVSTARARALYGPPAPIEAFDATPVEMSYEELPPEHLPPRDFADEWLVKTKEVIDGYRPDLLWFDNRMNILPESYRREMAAYYYNAADGEPWVLTYKGEEMRRGSGVLDLERNRMTETYPDPWLCDTSIAANSWAYATNLQYYSTARLIHDLVDIVSKNGCLLLNIAPAPDGTIPAEQQERLRGIGRWLQANGEAIYGTRPWKVFGEGDAVIPTGHLADLGFDGFTTEDIRFTVGRVGTLYATVLGWPGAGQAVAIAKLAEGGLMEGAVTSVELLSNGQPLEWERSTDALTIRLPEDLPKTEAVVFRLRVTR